MDPEDCLDLLEEAGCSKEVTEHCMAVAELAAAMAQRTAVDQQVVMAGALLHDVGRGFDHGPDHVPRGAAFLREKGIEEAIVDCVARHMGAGIEPEEARELGWPEGVWTPQRMEEKIVCHADNLTAGTTYRGVDDVVEDLEAKGLGNVIPRMHRLDAELSQALQQDPSAIAAQIR